MNAAAHTVAVILKGYPRLSETFIAQEIRGLEQRGLQLELVSLRQPTDPTTHPIHAEIEAPVAYLPEYLHQAPRRVLTAWLRARRLPGYIAAMRQFRADFARDRMRNRLRRFGQACVLATELGPHITWIYAHFLHTPASVARYAATMRGLPYSVSAHAVDIWTSPDWDLAEKIADAQWAAVCSEAGAEKLRALAAEPAKILRLYHGLDLERFPPYDAERGQADGTRPDAPVELLSVGRAVPKKGFDVLLEALALLPETLHWRWVHIGAGPEATRLKRQARALGLSEGISWRGAQPQDRVLAAMRGADLFVLPCRRDRDGNQDGLPNVLMEAQSQGLAVAATEFAAIPEFVIDNETGLLAAPGDAVSLQNALIRLITAPDLRFKIGQAGAARLRRHFNADQTLDRLAELLSDRNIAGAA